MLSQPSGVRVLKAVNSDNMSFTSYKTQILEHMRDRLYICEF
jgi:hypothetical protein